MLPSDGVSKPNFNTFRTDQIKCQLKPFFGAMFADSEVAKQYTMNKNKVSYFVLYGIALVLKEERTHVIFFE